MVFVGVFIDLFLVLMAIGFLLNAKNWADPILGKNEDYYKKIGFVFTVLSAVAIIVTIIIAFPSFDLLGVISLVGGLGALVFTIWFLVVFGKSKYKKSIVFLILAFVSIILSVLFNTTQTETFGRFIFYIGGTLLCVAGFFILFVVDIRKVGLIAILIGVIFVFVVSSFFGMKFVSRPKYNYSGNKDNGGFVGSDGKYHEYIPEFGDDVNDWMEENW